MKFLRLPSDASHVRGDGGALGDHALPFPAREICFVRSSMVAHALRTPTLYQKTRPADEKIADEFPPAGLPGLSQPGVCLMAR